MLTMIFTIAGSAIYWAASVGLIVLLMRMVIDWILFFAPTWRPQGPILLLANLVNAVTDPPLRFLRRRIPPLRLGGTMALDVGFMLLFVACLLLQRIGITVWLMGR